MMREKAKRFWQKVKKCKVSDKYLLHLNLNSLKFTNNLKI